MNKSEFIDISSFTKKIKRNWIFIAACLVLTMAAATVYLIRTPEVFQLNSQVLIKQDNSKGLGMSAAASMMKSFSFGDMLGGSSDVYDELQIIGSFSTLRDAIKRLGINTMYIESSLFKKVDYYKNSPLTLTPNTEIADSLRGGFKFLADVDASGNASLVMKKGWRTVCKASGKLPLTIKTPYASFVLSEGPGYEKRDISMKIFYFGLDYITEELYDKVSIDVATKKSNAIGLSYEDCNIQRGKDVLNTIVEEYEKQCVIAKQNKALKTSGFLDQRINVIRDDLSSLEAEIEQYKIKNNITNIETESSVLINFGTRYKEKLFDAESQYEVYCATEEVLTQKEKSYAMLPIAEAKQYNSLILKRMEIADKALESGEILRKMDDKIDAVRENLIKTIRVTKENLANGISRIKNEEAGFNNRLKGIPTQEREYIDMYRQQRLKQELYMFLLQKKEDAALAYNMTMPQAQIIDKAYAYFDPIKPKAILIILIALIAGLVSGICLIYAKDFIIKKKA